MTRILIGSLLLVTGLLAAQEGYPEIRYFNVRRDTLYRQQQDDLALSWRRRQAGEAPPPLVLYSYTLGEDDDLFSLAAATGLPYDTLAGLNNLETPGSLRSGDALLIPNQPGLFVPVDPQGDFAAFMSRTGRPEEDGQSLRIRRAGETVDYLFYPGASLDPEERSGFLGILFRSPLPGVVISSPYGYRHPVTGRWSFHPGVDFPVPVGTPVLASREGKVSETGRLENYGVYLILDHGDGYRTVYGHLDSLLVREGEVLKAGEPLALSGNSGISTGPHLHFEIRKGGRPLEPEQLLAGKQ